MDQENSILDRIISTQQISHREHFEPEATLNQLASNLTERERQVLWRRFGLAGGEPETLESIGNSFQVTRERIRQIQRLAVKKLQDEPKANASLHSVRQVIVEFLEAEGGIAPDVRLLTALSHLGTSANNNIIHFFLEELLSEVVISIGHEENSEYNFGWRLRTASLVALANVIEQAAEIISLHGSLMPEEQLGRELAERQLITPLGQPLTSNTLAISLLELSNKVRRNSFGEWGLAHWETVTPKRMNDKIYLVLKKHGKPLHFRDITKFINEQHFDHKVAYPPTVHNELIMDKKYVLVGRGIYALKEWGYSPGVVADILKDILEKKGEPMERDELVKEVLSQRLVKKGTIHLALTNRERFTRLENGKYVLASKL